MARFILLTGNLRFILTLGLLFVSGIQGRAQSFTFSTLAGVGCGSADGTNVTARFFYPRGAALDGAGNIYVADTGNHTIRKITPAGVVTTFAGLAGNPGIADGPVSIARFNGPSGVLVDANNNVFVADTGNHTIRMITPDGTVSTLAGLAGNHGATDGTNAVARFNHPIHLAMDGGGTLYVADTFNHVIRKVRRNPDTGDWIVTTLAGLAGVSGNADATGSAARFYYPWDVAVDSLGFVYVADAANCTIRKISPLGAVSTLAGLAGSVGITNGTGSAARFVYPCGLSLGDPGNLYVADSGGYTVRKVNTTSGVVTTVAGWAGAIGNSDGIGTSALFNHPAGIAANGLGTLFVADSGNNTIRTITPGGVVTTLAGLAAGISGAAEGTNTTVRLRFAQGVASDSAGNLYVADTGNHTIRKVSPAGVSSTLAGLAGSPGTTDSTNSAARFNSPTGIALDLAGNIYVADSGNHTIRKITPAGSVSTLAGLTNQPGSSDGTNTDARFSTPAGVAVDATGNIYVADFGNDTIRMVTPQGVVTTLAGLASVPGAADGTNSDARFYTPRGIAVDSQTNLYVADTGNHTIRKIAPGGMVTTLAGLAGYPGITDGTNSAAQFYYPESLAVDAAGNIFVTDTYAHTLREITPAGLVTTIAGSPGSLGVADDIGGSAQFFFPQGIALDAATNIYVADTFNSSIRKGAFYNPPVVTADLPNQTIIGGNTLTLSVSATGAGLSFQWRKNGVIIANATNATLVIASPGINDAGVYDVVVSNSTGSATSGSATISVIVPPNDLFGNAITLSGTNLLTTGSNVGAGKAAGEPNHAGNFGGRSVWWSWTAPMDSTVSLSTSGSLFDTLLAVYTGNSVSALTPVVANDDFAPGDVTSRTSFGAVAGATYRIAVDGFNAASGNIVLSLTTGPPVPPSIIQSPKPQVDIPGAIVALGVFASGSPPLKFQWRKNSIPITDGNSDRLILTNLSSNDVASYDVVVTNVFNVAVSSNALVSLTNGYAFSTVAGTPGYGSADGIGHDAQFHSPGDVTTDTAGNVYVADTFNFTIRKVTPQGVVTTLAGQAGEPGSVDGTGNGALFYLPTSVTADAAGNVYVADGGNYTIRKITPLGVVTTLAGRAGFPGSADGTNTTARFFNPASVAIDTSGNLFVADAGNHTIRKVTPAGVVTTWAGLAGAAGTADGTNTDARFSSPSGVAVDAATNVYVADFGNDLIRKISPAQVVTTIAGQPLVPGTSDGTGTNAAFHSPAGVSVDAFGNVYVADTYNHSIRSITPAGLVATLAGLSGVSGDIDGTNTAARFARPQGVALDLFGNLYIADTDNHQVRRSTLAGEVTTLAGAIGPGSSNGPGAIARFNQPAGIGVDTNGNIYVADNNNSTIRKISIGGIVSTPAGVPMNQGSSDGTNTDARFSVPSGVAVAASGDVYVADTWNHTIRKMTPAGVVTTYAGQAGNIGASNGSLANAQFSYPSSVAIDAASNLFVADNGNNLVRKITPGGLVSTLAGSVGVIGSSDGTGTNAVFSALTGIAVDGADNVYVADSVNCTIRKITQAGVVTTIAGLSGVTGDADGTGSVARFGQPFGVATDTSGNVYVSDASNHTVRVIAPSGMVSTLGGLAGNPGAQDATGTGARFNGPQALFVDAAGKVYVADTANFDVRVGHAIIPPGPPLQIALTGGHVILSWTTNSTGYFLESANGSTPGAAWAPVTNGVLSIVGGNYVWSNTFVPLPTFYRLHKP